MEFDSDILTIADVAEFLHCSEPHFGRLINGAVRGVPALPAIALGRRKLVRRKSLLQWLDAVEGNGTIAASYGIDGGRRALGEIRMRKSWQRGSLKQRCR